VVGATVSAVTWWCLSNSISNNGKGVSNSKTNTITQADHAEVLDNETEEAEDSQNLVNLLYGIAEDQARKGKAPEQ
jgi:hypothetical protein